MTYFSKVIELSTDNYVILNNIAGIISKKGKYEKATQYFEKALFVKSGYSHSLFGALSNFYLGE